MTISNLIRILTGAADGFRDEREALPGLRKEADKAWRRADRRIERARLGAQAAIGVLEKARINTLAVQMDEFLQEYEALKNVRLEDCAEVIPLPKEPLDLKKLHRLVDMYDRIRDAGTVGYAMRSESAMLFGPGLLTWAARTPEIHFSEETLQTGTVEELRKVADDLRAFGEKVTKTCSRLQSIRHAAQKAAEVMFDLSDFLEDCKEDIREIRRLHGDDWNHYSFNDKLFVARGLQIAELVQEMSDFHVLTENADFKDSLVVSTKRAREVIHDLGA